MKELTVKATENIKSEIARTKKDIAALPEVFSPAYVQSKVQEIRLPNLPKIELNQSIIQGDSFKWDPPSIKLPILISQRIDENNVLEKIKIAVDKGLGDTGKALTIAGRDIVDWWPDTEKWLKEHLKFPEHGECDSDANDTEKEICISKLKSEIESQEAELKRRRNAIGKWVSSQSELLKK
ncbi:MAG: hypothetical protein NTX25_24140 [Proteobacteria bacterium]|nr:hypothetical protein [Pseudomonadota bacterium]